MQDWLNVINESESLECEELIPFNFRDFLANHIDDNFNRLAINSSYIFKFTSEGIRSKQYHDDKEFSTWRGSDARNGRSLEPFKILTSEPKGKPKPLTPTKEISPSDLRAIQNLVKEESKYYFDDLITSKTRIGEFSHITRIERSAATDSTVDESQNFNDTPLGSILGDKLCRTTFQRFYRLQRLGEVDQWVTEDEFNDEYKQYKVLLKNYLEKKPMLKKKRGKRRERDYSPPRKIRRK